jgi:hypothetical protein
MKKHGRWRSRLQISVVAECPQSLCYRFDRLKGAGRPDQVRQLAVNRALATAKDGRLAPLIQISEVVLWD